MGVYFSHLFGWILKLAIFWHFYEKERRINLNSSSGPLLGGSIILEVHNTGTEESANQDACFWFRIININGVLGPSINYVISLGNGGEGGNPKDIT